LSEWIANKRSFYFKRKHNWCSRRLKILQIVKIFHFYNVIVIQTFWGCGTQNDLKKIRGTQKTIKETLRNPVFLKSTEYLPMPKPTLPKLTSKNLTSLFGSIVKYLWLFKYSLKWSALYKKQKKQWSDIWPNPEIF
jgi:hypothetical protein